MIRKLCVGAGCLCLLVGLILGTERVRLHARTEVTRVSGPRIATRPGELSREALYEGQRVVFEVCSIEPDAFGPAFVDALAIEIVVVPSGETALRVVTDAARLSGARRSREGVCVHVGTAERLGATGVFAMRLVPLREEMPHVVTHMPIVGRIVAVTPVSDADFFPVMICLLGVVLVLVGSIEKPTEGEVAPVPTATAYLATAFALVGVGLAFFAGRWLPPWGAPVVLLNATLIIAVELLAIVLVARALDVRKASLVALTRPSLVYVPIAIIVGIGLYFAGGALSRLVPSTGVAPIETLVSMTSGFVAVALVSVLAPIAEELFFRGVVYGAIAKSGSENGAALVSFVVFVLVHVPQDFGAWGPLASITLTGAVLVGLRRASGSVVVPALAHLVHNSMITVLSFAAHA